MQRPSTEKSDEMGKSISEFQIWHKIITGLNKTGLEYILVGAGALVVHGLPRSTLDIDIYVTANKETLNKLFRIANRLGLHSEQSAILKLSHSPKLYVNQWISFSYEGQDVLDVFLADEEEFNRLYQNSEQKQDKTLLVRVASLSDIGNMKKVTGRAVDKADLELIKEAKRYKKKEE